MNAKKPTPGHILIKMPNVKTKRILKAERKNQLQHNLTGKECCGDLRRLAEHPQAAAQGG